MASYLNQPDGSNTCCDCPDRTSPCDPCGDICPITDVCLDTGSITITFEGITVGCGCQDLSPYLDNESLIATDININPPAHVTLISGSPPYIEISGGAQYHIELYFADGCTTDDPGVGCSGDTCSDKGAATFTICAADNSGLYVFYKEAEAVFFAKVTSFGVATPNLLGSGDPDYPGCGGLFTVPLELQPYYGSTGWPVVAQGGTCTVVCGGF